MTNPEQTYNLMQEVLLLDPKRVRLFCDEFEELYLQAGDNEPVGPLTVQLAFPVSNAEEFVTLIDCQDKEVGILGRLCDLDRDSRAVVENELEWAYFAATITAVHSIDQGFFPRWYVDTDRGRRVFVLRSSRSDIRVLPNGRVFLRDADGNRYEISDATTLDQVTRAAIEEWI